MNLDGTTINDLQTSSKPEPSPARPYRLYGAMFALFLAVRFGDLLIRDMEWTVWFHGSLMCAVLSAMVAAVGAYVTARYLSSRIPKLMAWLMCGFVGASAMLLTNSGYGMAIGFLVGAIANFDQAGERSRTLVSSLPKWAVVCFQFCARIALRLLVPTSIGLVTGGVAALAYIYFGQTTRTTEVLSLGAAMISGVALFIFAMRRVSNKRWYSWALAVPIFGICAIVGLLLTSFHDGQRRREKISHVRSDSTGLVESFVSIAGLYPAVMGMTQNQLQLLGGLDFLTQGVHFGRLTFGERSQDADIDVARGLPLLTAVDFEQGSRVTDAAVNKLRLRYLSRFRAGPGTMLTDATPMGIDKSKLQMSVIKIKEHIEQLWLRRPNNVRATIRSVTLTVENMEDILAAATVAGPWKFVLKDAVDAEGKPRPFYNVRQELKSDLLSAKLPSMP